MKKKTIITILMISMLVLGMTGCQEEKASGSDNKDNTVMQECSLCEIEKECGIYTVDGQEYVVCDDCYNEFACGMGLVDEQENSDNLASYMASIEEQSDSIKYSLENDVLTQLEMNEKSLELYELWDGALNYLWSELKNVLPEDEFEELRDKQRTWISEKEEAVEIAGKEFEGGSMYSMVANGEAARITEERVYELYELLK